ncbi:rhodanese-like domain-containing protein [Pleurocapsales cyanobacterium LEGE 06147]|nr:rhodanese-like domain-containing protein [Pleurocapsales cyanobacterium LEGE 06147]
MLILRILGWAIAKFIIRLRFPEVQHLSTQDLAAWLQQDDIRQPLLLDVRSEEEYAVSHLPNAMLTPNNLEHLVARHDFATPIVTYCSIGYRSAAIARRLKTMGYKNVFNLSGSIFEWFNEGRPVYQGKQEVKTVHPYNRFWQFLLHPLSRDVPGNVPTR